jgi:nitrogen fixation protein FixH
MSSADHSEFRLKGWHVLVILIGFFGVIFAVNGVIIYEGIVTNPGEDTQHAYQQGIDYNQELAEQAAQEKLGWQAAIKLGEANGMKTIELAYTDKKGEPVLGLKLDAELRNPVVAERDRPLVFTPIGPGRFAAKFSDPHDARWDLLVTARSQTGEEFKLKHRL